MIGCNEVVTLFHRQKDMQGNETMDATVISGVSWFERQTMKNSSGHEMISRVIAVRIPLDADTQGKKYVPWESWNGENSGQIWTIKLGDILVRGQIDAENISASKLLNEYGGFVVQTFSDNRRGILPHWKAGGGTNQQNASTQFRA